MSSELSALERAEALAQQLLAAALAEGAVAVVVGVVFEEGRVASEEASLEEKYPYWVRYQGPAMLVQRLGDEVVVRTSVPTLVPEPSTEPSS